MAEGVQIINRLLQELQPWWGVVMTLCYLCGFCLAGTAVLSLCANENMFQQAGIGKKLGPAAITFFAAVAMINMPAFLDTVAFSFFGHGSLQALSYSSGGGSPYAVYLKFAKFIFALVGAVTCLSGLFKIKNSSQKPDSFWPGVGQIVGGVLAINIDALMRMIGSSTGGSIQSTMSALVEMSG